MPRHHPFYFRQWRRKGVEFGMGCRGFNANDLTMAEHMQQQQHIATPMTK